MRIPARDAWYEATTFAKATVSNLRQPDRKRRVHRALRQWSFTADGLPRAPLAELFTDIEHVRSGATPANRHFYELPYAERFVLDALIRHLEARSIFEFGTFRGMTTRLLAETVGPGGVIHTIDLPRPAGTPASDDPVGVELRALTGDVAEVVEHRCDTADFDFSPLAARFDLVFVDASHRYDDVLRDSRDALRIVRPGGLIVWDDYQAEEPGVVRALHELAADLAIVNVRWTRLAVLTAS